MLLDRYLCIFSIFRVFHVLITFWSIAYGALEFRLCFFGDFSTFERVLLIFMILSDFASMARAKQHRERQKWMRFYTFSQVGRRRVFLTNATPGFVFFVIILWWIFDDFEHFLHPWREQSNTGNDKNERNLMHFRRSSDGVRFWPLQHRGVCFFVLILRWF